MGAVCTGDYSGGIYGGIFTPTEASMVAVAYAFFIGVFVHREVKISELGSVIIQSMKTTTLVMFIVATASAFGWLLAYEQVPSQVVGVILSISDNKIVILLMLNIILLLIGAVMDNLAAMIILAPLLIKLGVQLGLDPIQLGTIVVINFAVGMETPPLGYSLFVASAISGLSIEETAEAVSLSPATVKRHWNVARTWLFDALSENQGPSSPSS